MLSVLVGRSHLGLLAIRCLESISTDLIICQKIEFVVKIEKLGKALHKLQWRVQLTDASSFRFSAKCLLLKIVTLSLLLNRTIVWIPIGIRPL